MMSFPLHWQMIVVDRPFNTSPHQKLHHTIPKQVRTIVKLNKLWLPNMEALCAKKKTWKLCWNSRFLSEFSKSECLIIIRISECMQVNMVRCSRSALVAQYHRYSKWAKYGLFGAKHEWRHIGDTSKNLFLLDGSRNKQLISVKRHFIFSDYFS